MNLILSRMLLFLTLVLPFTCDIYDGQKNIVSAVDGETNTLAHRLKKSSSTEMQAYNYTKQNHSEIALLVVKHAFQLSTSKICGGILVSERVFITAAHCLYDSQGYFKMYPNMFRVEQGKAGVFENVGSRGSVGSVAKLIVAHPKYSQYGKGNDIGAIRLRAGINDAAAVTRIPSVPLTYSWKRGSRLEMLFFFIESEDGRRVVWRRMPARITGKPRCEEMYRRWGIHIGRQQLCIELVNSNFYHSGEHAMLLFNGQPIGVLSLKFDVSSRALSFPFIFTEFAWYGEFIQNEINNDDGLRLRPYKICTSILYIVLSIGVIQ